MSNDTNTKREGLVTPGQDTPRRRFLRRMGLGMGAVGGAATAVPFVASMSPSDRAKAAGAPVEIDISELKPGEMMTVAWRGKPVWVLRRTPEMLATLKEIEGEIADPASEKSLQPDYASGELRSAREDILVLEGVCTHLGCAPVTAFDAGKDSGVSDDWIGGFFCPCHGSKFDFAGRVYKGVPAPTNLPVPPHRFVTDNLIVVGEDPEESA